MADLELAQMLYDSGIATREQAERLAVLLAASNASQWPGAIPVTPDPIIDRADVDTA